MTSVSQAPSASDVPVNHLEGLNPGQVYAQLTQLLPASADESFTASYPRRGHGNNLRVEVFLEGSDIIVRARSSFTADEWTIGPDGRVIKTEFHAMKGRMSSRFGDPLNLPLTSHPHFTLKEVIEALVPSLASTAEATREAVGETLES